MVVWGVLAAFVGLKGIQYVAKVATYLPLIPLVMLLWLTATTIGSVGSFDPTTLIAAQNRGHVPTAPPRLTHDRRAGRDADLRRRLLRHRGRRGRGFRH